MKIIKVDCCMDCPYTFAVYQGSNLFSPRCKELNRNIPVKTFETRKIWGKCRLEDKK